MAYNSLPIKVKAAVEADNNIVNDFVKDLPNPNKTISITRTNTAGSNLNWTQNLSSLLFNNSKRGKYSVFQGLSLQNKESIESLWDVNEKVYLLLKENKGLKITNSTSKPLSKLTESVQNNNSSLVSKLGAMAIGAYEAFDAFRTSWNKGNNLTSGVFNPWFTNISAWNGVNKMNLNYTFDFAMGQYGLWNAKEEVVKPIFNLLAPVLPQYLDTVMQYGAFPNTLQLLVSLISDVVTVLGNTDLKFTDTTSAADVSDNDWKDVPALYNQEERSKNDRDRIGGQSAEQVKESVTQSMNRRVEELKGDYGSFLKGLTSNVYEEKSWGRSEFYYVIKYNVEAHKKNKKTNERRAPDGTRETDLYINKNDIEDKSYLDDIANNYKGSGLETKNLGSVLEEILIHEYTKYTYDITFGNTFTFYKMLPISANVTFSNEVDQDGWPIKGSIEMTWEGIAPPALTTATQNELAVKFAPKNW